jgi:hypothetical protein
MSNWYAKETEVRSEFAEIWAELADIIQRLTELEQNKSMFASNGSEWEDKTLGPGNRPPIICPICGVSYQPSVTIHTCKETIS